MESPPRPLHPRQRECAERTRPSALGSCMHPGAAPAITATRHPYQNNRKTRKSNPAIILQPSSPRRARRGGPNATVADATERHLAPSRPPPSMELQKRSSCITMSKRREAGSTLRTLLHRAAVAAPAAVASLAQAKEMQEYLLLLPPPNSQRPRHRQTTDTRAGTLRGPLCLPRPAPRLPLPWEYGPVRRTGGPPPPPPPTFGLHERRAPWRRFASRPSVEAPPPSRDRLPDGPASDGDLLPFVSASAARCAARCAVADGDGCGDGLVGALPGIAPAAPARRGADCDGGSAAAACCARSARGRGSRPIRREAVLPLRMSRESSGRRVCGSTSLCAVAISAVSASVAAAPAACSSGRGPRSPARIAASRRACSRAELVEGCGLPTHEQPSLAIQHSTMHDRTCSRTSTACMNTPR